MAMPLNIEHYDLNDANGYEQFATVEEYGRCKLGLSDEDYEDYRETMHVDPYEILDDFPALVEGEVEE